jgi:hypothetical protein
LLDKLWTNGGMTPTVRLPVAVARAEAWTASRICVVKFAEAIELAMASDASEGPP